MNMSMNLKKGDAMSEALAEFWGTSKPEETNVVGLGQDLLTPEEASSDMQTEGMSIKERVESQVAQTQDLTPDARAAARYAGMQKSKANPFDLGGFDAMIQKQMARERGSGLGIGLGFGQEKLPFEERVTRETIGLRLKELKQNVAASGVQNKLLLAEQRQTLAQRAMQARNTSEIQRQIARTYKEDATKVRLQAGLPVYESPLDILAGGKKMKRVLNEKTGKYEYTGEIERYGGLFGAVGEVYKGYKAATGVVKSHSQRMEAEKELYETKQQKKDREEAERKEGLYKEEALRRETLSMEDVRKQYNLDRADALAKAEAARIKQRLEERRPTTNTVVTFTNPKRAPETIRTATSNMFGGNMKSPTSFEVDRGTPMMNNSFGYDMPGPKGKSMPDDVLGGIVNREMASMNKDKIKNPKTEDIKDLRDV